MLKVLKALIEAKVEGIAYHPANFTGQDISFSVENAPDIFSYISFGASKINADADKQAAENGFVNPLNSIKLYRKDFIKAGISEGQLHKIEQDQTQYILNNTPIAIRNLQDRLNSLLTTSKEAVNLDKLAQEYIEDILVISKKLGISVPSKEKLKQLPNSAYGNLAGIASGMRFIEKDYERFKAIIIRTNKLNMNEKSYSVKLFSMLQARNMKPDSFAELIVNQISQTLQNLCNSKISCNEKQVINDEAKKLFNDFHSKLHDKKDKLDCVECFIDFIKSIFGCGVANKIFEQTKGTFLNKINNERLNVILNISDPICNQR